MRFLYSLSRSYYISPAVFYNCGLEIYPKISEDCLLPGVNSCLPIYVLYYSTTKLQQLYTTFLAPRK